MQYPTQSPTNHGIFTYANQPPKEPVGGEDTDRKEGERGG